MGTGPDWPRATMEARVEPMTKRPEIYFTAWQDNNYQEALRPNGGRLVKIWDNYNDLCLLEAIATPEVIQKFYQERILQASNRSIIPAKARPKIFNDPLNYDPFSIGDIYILSFGYYDSDEAIEKFKDQFRSWMRQVADEAASVGGDDAYFDYYPDNWEVALQIAKALGMKEDYTKYRDIAYNLRYADDPDDNLLEWTEG